MSGFVVLGMFIYVLTLIYLLFIPCVFKNDLRWGVVKPHIKTPPFFKKKKQQLFNNNIKNVFGNLARTSKALKLNL